MNRLFIHNVFFRLAGPPVFGVMIYLLLLLVNNTVENIGQLFSNQELYVSIGLCYISFEAIRIVIVILNKKLDAETAFQKRILIQLIFSLIASLTTVGISISAYFKYVIGFSIGSVELNLFLLIYGAAGLLYNILFFSQYFLFTENKLKVEQERAMRENLEAEFDTFKNDINPHLLYESLESLILALQRNVDQADELIDYLAGIYRYQLVNRHKELVPLNEELGAANYLIGLLNFRHRNRIKLDVESRKPENTLIIPGSLVVSVDAVVRNTLINENDNFVIKLYFEDEYLVLSHRINDKLLLHDESLQAFERIQRSYKFFSDMPFVQVKTDQENYIKFPLVNVAANQLIDQTA